ncbi:MAG: DUF4349 domain-containing protein [Chloroflexi bacterium]|nr:DUF4349 domain-containing protein [Chloroflexota bacterium]
MKKLLSFSFILAVALVLTACGTRAQAPSYDMVSPAGGVAPMEAPVAPESGITDQAASGGGGDTANATERIVIKNADIAIVVSDVDKRMQDIQAMAQEMGGFVVSSNLYQSYTSDYVEVPEAQVVIRVPAEKLDEALEQIKKDVVEVQTETRSGQDVTAEYVDLQSRLKNLEAAESQLNEILKTATETEDVINVFNQLVYYREQIELVKGQIKYYDEAAALSSISIRIIAEETVKPLVIGKWEPKGVALEAVQDLVDFYQGFTEFLIRFAIYILPVTLTLIFFVYLLFLGGRALFRKMRGSKVKKDQPKVEEKKQ